MKGLSSKLHFTLYFWSITLFATSIHWWHSLTVIMMIIIGVIWIIQPNLSSKLLLTFKRPSIFLFSTIFILSLFYLPFSNNILESLNYTKLVLPVFLLPLFIETSPKFTSKDFSTIIYLYILSTVISTIFNLIHFIKDYNSFTDIRSISFYMSHIRYSLFITIAIFSCIYYLFINRTKGILTTVLLSLSLAWLILFIFILQSVTGIVIVFFILFLLLCIKIYKSKSNINRLIIITSVLIIIASISWNLLNLINEFTNVKKIEIKDREKKTPYGNEYTYNDKIRVQENGNFVYYFFCEKELQETWNSISSIKYNGLDKKKQPINFTLIRYLTSKNLRKDKDGVLALNAHDRLNIENGITNYKHDNIFSFDNRIYEIIWEIDSYRRGTNPSGHSITQRFEFWRCAKAIISDNFFLGIGTSDFDKIVQKYYIKIDSKLPINKRYSPHNQYFTFMIKFGCIGLLLIIAGILATVIFEKKQKDYFVLILLTILFISMINEDTLERQHGIVLFAFWGALFIFGRIDKKDDPTIKEENEELSE